MGEYAAGKVEGVPTAKGLVFPGVWVAAQGKAAVPWQRHDLSLSVKTGNRKDQRRAA